MEKQPTFLTLPSTPRSRHGGDISRVRVFSSGVGSYLPCSSLRPETSGLAPDWFAAPPAPGGCLGGGIGAGNPETPGGDDWDRVCGVRGQGEAGVRDAPSRRPRPPHRLPRLPHARGTGIFTAPPPPPVPQTHGRRLGRERRCSGVTRRMEDGRWI